MKKETKKEKTVIRKRTWTIEFIEYSDGSAVMHRTNGGFKAFELLGLVEEAREDIIQQVRGNIKPHVTKRNVITD